MFVDYPPPLRSGLVGVNLLARWVGVDGGLGGYYNYIRDGAYQVMLWLTGVWGGITMRWPGLWRVFGFFESC